MQARRMANRWRTLTAGLVLTAGLMRAPMLVLAAAFMLPFTGCGCADLLPGPPPVVCPAPLQAGWVETTVTRPDGTRFGARLFYPATACQAGALYEHSGAPYPIVAFGHGYMQSPDTYQLTLAYLAVQGYLVIAARSGVELFPSHAAFAEDLRHCITHLLTQNADPASPWFGQVAADAPGLLGHSMGGGASILAAVRDRRVRAVVALAAANTRPSAIAASPELTAPVLLIDGSDDRLVPSATNGQRMYDQAPAPKQLALIVGAYHCGFVDTDFPIGCDSGAISKADQLAITQRRVGLFFDCHLKGDEAACAAVWEPVGEDGPERVQQALAEPQP